MNKLGARITNKGGLFHDHLGIDTTRYGCSSTISPEGPRADTGAEAKCRFLRGSGGKGLLSGIGESGGEIET